MEAINTSPIIRKKAIWIKRASAWGILMAMVISCLIPFNKKTLKQPKIKEIVIEDNFINMRNSEYTNLLSEPEIFHNTKNNKEQSELEDVPEEVIEEEKNGQVQMPIYNDIPVPKNNSFKSYMDYKTITDRTSAQYELQKLYSSTDANGIRIVGERYCVAIGSGFDCAIGDEIELIMESGEVIKCVVADIKADKDTDLTNKQHNVDNSVCEFIVDTDLLSDVVRKMGDISYADKLFKGNILSVRKHY